ncbi:hypothetical protein [Gracilibacillus sp. Marseille-QA3620]
MIGNRSFALFYAGFQMTLMMAFALDSQEVTFIKQNLGASDSLYGIIVALTGGGAGVGGIATASMTAKLSVKAYIGFSFFVHDGFLYDSLCDQYPMDGCGRLYPAGACHVLLQYLI